MKSTQFIKYENVIYLPRPTSVNAGHSRHIWVEKCLGREPHIAHPDMWKWLLERSHVNLLVETESGFEIRPVEASSSQAFM